MASLNADEDGFLTGTASENLEKIAREIEILKAIHEDTSATLEKLTSIAASLTAATVDVRAPTSGAPVIVPIIAPAPASPPDAVPDPSPAPADPAPAPSTAPSAAPTPAPAPPETAPDSTTVIVPVLGPPPIPAPLPPAVPPPAPVPPASPPDRERDESGRWRRRNAGPDGSPPDAAPPADDKESRDSHAMEDAADTLKGVASAVGSGADGIDPTVQAVKEIGGVFAPVVGVLKPLGRLFGIGRRPEQKAQRENVMWYRRIWNAVKGERGGGGGMGLVMTALLSMLGMLLAPLKALSKLMGLTSLLKGAASMLPGRGRSRTGAGGRPTPRPRPGGAPPPAGGGPTPRPRPGGPPPPAGGGPTPRPRPGGGPPVPRPRPVPPPRPPSGGMLKGMLKKLPFVGALIGGAMLASDVMADDDPNLTQEENKKERYGNIGSGVGGLVGGVVGLLGGPAGAIAGAMIGDQLGGMVGNWLATVDLGSVPGRISEAFTILKDGALLAATSAFDLVKDTWSGMVATGTKLLAGMTDSIKEAFGKAADFVLGIKDVVADKVQSAKDYVGETATGVVDSGQNLLNRATGGRYTGGSNARKDELIKAMDAGGITDQKSKAMLMANVDHESGGFTKNEENLNYSAKRLQQVFPKYYSTPESARADANNPEAIANKVYGGRMGNKDAGDGYKFRGRGDIQLTGRDQYEDMGKKLGVDLVNNPDLAKDPKISAQIAVQHWKSSGADRAAIAGDQDRARKLTNGGANGLEDVKSKYDGYLAQAQAGDLTPARRADQGTVQAPTGANAAMASTMAAVRGAPAVGVTPIGPRQPVAPAIAGAQTVGVMAPTATATAPSIGMASMTPISAGAMIAPSYSAPAPDASTFKIAPTPVVEKPLMGASKAAAAPGVQLSVPLSQNLEDRQIAHVASGGMGMGPGR